MYSYDKNWQQISPDFYQIVDALQRLPVNVQLLLTLSRIDIIHNILF